MRKTKDRDNEAPDKKSSIIAPIVVGVVIALVAGSTAPWWWSMVFPSKQDGEPIIISRSGRLERIAGNEHCQGDERNWVDITSDLKIGLLGVRTGEKPGEKNRVDIRVVQTRGGKTLPFHDIHPQKDWTVPLGVGNLKIYIKPQIDDCWIDYEIYSK
jgi:hypothetical protein